jgi:hypothetical protein
MRPSNDPRAKISRAQSGASMGMRVAIPIKAAFFPPVPSVSPELVEDLYEPARGKIFQVGNF